MATVRMAELLQADEGKLHNELRADSGIDRNLNQSVLRLREELSMILLRYNASNSDSPLHQALADSMMAPAQELLELLTACEAKKETEKRRLRAGAVIALLLSVICCLCAALLVRTSFPAGCGCMAGAAVFAFLAGRLWYGEREVQVHTELNADAVLRAVRKSIDTMDRKSGEFLALEASQAQERSEASPSAAGALTPEELKLFGTLLEALYSGNGEFALRQLRRVPDLLRGLGCELREFSPEDVELFELLPSKNRSVTLRPAIVKDGQLLLVGRATEVTG